jgi:hypothetical protein
MLQKQPRVAAVKRALEIAVPGDEYVMQVSDLPYRVPVEIGKAKTIAVKENLNRIKT